MNNPFAKKTTEVESLSTPEVTPDFKEGNILNGPNEHEGKPEDTKVIAKIAKKKNVKPNRTKTAEVKEEVEDRSLFNCDDCGGDGLVDQGTKKIICTVCGGTGKVK